MKWIKGVAVYLFIAGLFYVVFAYVAGFSTRQSIVLAVLIAFLERGIRDAAAKPARRFSPYWVNVYPNWYQLLIDFKLVNNPEEWRDMQKSFEALPSTEYRVLRSGISFTVVDQSEDFERTLIYLNNYRVFIGDVDFREEMEPIKIEREHSIPILSKYDVDFFMKVGAGGYILGIMVPDWWWDEVKGACPKPMEEDKDYATGRVQLILATIPYREFDLYWEPVTWDSAWLNQVNARRDKERTKFGWTNAKREDIPELGSVVWPESMKHKYFKVDHCGI